MTDEQQRITYAGTLLEGKALTWFRAQLSTATPGYNKYDYWQEFKDALTGAFQDLEREIRLRRRLASMHHTGNVSGYVAAFRALMVEMEDAAPPNDAAKFYFVEGCQPDIKTQLLVQDPVDLEDAMRTAERLGLAIRPEKGKDRLRP